MNVLHLTHTDINSDSRILKEMLAIAKSSANYKVNGIGVNLDEEAANLLSYQQAYQASAKMLQVASELFDTLLSIGA